MAAGAFRFTTALRVRNYEVDWQGIVHNAAYLLYFETGRVEYLEHMGVPMDEASVRGPSRVVVARNEIDYLAPARYGDRIEVHTRVASVGTTSIVFEGVLRGAADGAVLAKNVCVLVWLDGASGRPAPVPERFRGRIAEFEGSAGASRPAVSP